MDPNNKVALVTGGASGLGLALARALGARGATVILADRDLSAAEGAAQTLQGEGIAADYLSCDVASAQQVGEIVTEVLARHGAIDILVNNAGVVDKKARVQDMTAERLTRMFTVNTISTFLCCREAVKRMSTELGKNGGSIINVSSAAARLGSANQYVDYAASKGAMDVLTIGLAQEVAAAGIRVNAVRPGLIDTEIHASGGLPNRVNDLAATVPMGRGGSATEVAEVILWLASDQASYTTMSFIDVSGGR